MVSMNSVVLSLVLCISFAKSHDTGGFVNLDSDRDSRDHHQLNSIQFQPVGAHRIGDVGGFVNLDSDRYPTRRHFSVTNRRGSTQDTGGFVNLDSDQRPLFFTLEDPNDKPWRNWNPQLLQGSLLAFDPPYRKIVRQYRIFVGADLNRCGSFYSMTKRALCYNTKNFQMQPVPGIRYTVEISYQAKGFPYGFWTNWMYLTTLYGNQ